MMEIIATKRFKYKNKYRYAAWLKKQNDSTFTVNVGSLQDSAYDTWWILPVSEEKAAHKLFTMIARMYIKSTSAKTDENLHYRLNDKDIYEADMKEHPEWD